MLGKPALSTGTVYLSRWFDSAISQINVIMFPFLSIQCSKLMVLFCTMVLLLNKRHNSLQYETGLIYQHRKSCSSTSISICYILNYFYPVKYDTVFP